MSFHHYNLCHKHIHLFQKIPSFHFYYLYYFVPSECLTYNLCSSSSVQFSSVTQSCPTLCDPMNLSTPGLPVHHQRPKFTQTHIHRLNDAIQPSHPLSSPSPLAPNPSQDQSLFQWVNSQMCRPDSFTVVIFLFYNTLISPEKNDLEVVFVKD